MSFADKYPELVKYLDNTDDYENSSFEFDENGNRKLMVIQRGPIDSGSVLFEMTERGWQPVDADTLLDTAVPSLERAEIEAVCSVSSAEDHVIVAAEIKDQVDQFSSATGPDGGNLACVWAVRHIVEAVLDRWITRTDGTAVFDPELRQCFSPSLDGVGIPAGGIIISPTETNASGQRNIGHIGLLGPEASDDRRLIYSNSSSAAMWKQNFTVKSWKAKYQTQKQLKVHFYPLPLK
ncbi:hypothetical protein [Bosea sp. BK604]|uniref:hypothetical protein n=1 Tax=Bosea sp. BK604 TaxID=2512180 RepID=UPI0010447BAB|nr:hypothetical protein [Bosea sp. BK604]TCR70267.1 hypothetical protein EV560_101673 [Bosea sp. BK604]